MEDVRFKTKLCPFCFLRFIIDKSQGLVTARLLINRTWAFECAHATSSKCCCNNSSVGLGTKSCGDFLARTHFSKSGSAWDDQSMSYMLLQPETGLWAEGKWSLGSWICKVNKLTHFLEATDGSLVQLPAFSLSSSLWICGEIII